MSKKPSGAEFRRRAKEREKETHQSSVLLSSWLNVKNNYEEDDSRGKEERNDEFVIPESVALVKTVKSLEKSPTTHRANQDEIKVEFPISHCQSRTEAEQDSNSIAGTCHEAAFYNPGSGLSHTQCDFQFDFNDPGTWPTNISDTQRCFIVTQLMNGTKVEPDLGNSLRDGRKLTKEWFYKKLSNEQKVYRSWLSYSKSKNALFCIPCKLFSYSFSEQKVQNHSFLAKDEGFTQWKKLSNKIPEHENSLNHKKCFCLWKTLESSLNKSGIDKELQEKIAEEENHWRTILYVIIDIIIYLAKQGSPFRGSIESSDFGDPRSGKFLNTVELVSHYHPPLRDHIRRHKKGQVSYFSSSVQNEFLEIIGNKIREQIFNDIREAKYFSVMFDCTPDVSHLEQMSEVIRYVKIGENGPEVVESFIDFIMVSEKTGLALSEIIMKKLESDGLNLKNCRGQSYDNGANMAGKYKGVQTRLQEKNNLAYFVPCAAHSLNLVGVNAASVSQETEKYFGTLNCVYSFFAASTNRWEVLLKYVPLSLKLQSNTRWSTKREAVTVIYKHLKKVIDALNALITSKVANVETKTEAASLLKNIKTFEFIVLSCFWYKQLTRIDIVNKLFQREDITIDQSVKHINRLIEQLQATRANNATDAISEAKKIAEELSLNPCFRQVRKRKKKRMFDENCEDESYQWSEEKKFRILILQAIDRILNELRNRFEALQNINGMFGFLHGSQFQSMTNEELKIQATKLANIYKEDLNKDELVIEAESFKYHALDLTPNMKTATPAGILSLIYKNGLQDAYPNITTALRIFLTIPVSVASNERSFSKLKIVKNYLRNLTLQERLTNLSIITIEHGFVSKQSYDSIIKTFAAKKARKVKF